jgi:hypothetical protein
MNLAETPKKAHIRHRLYVILPLFLVLATAGIGGHSAASVTETSAVTQSGSVIAGKSLISFEENGYAFTAWNGALVVDGEEDQPLTIAALTTPVLVQRDTDAWLVPVGMQLTIKTASTTSPADIADWVHSRRPLPLPAHYLREMLPLAESLLAETTVQGLTAPEALISPLTGSALMLDAARADAESDTHAQQLAHLSDALIDGDTAAFDMLLSAAGTREALDDATAGDLATLLSLAMTQKRDMQILSSILTSPQMALVLRFHPLTRNRVWLTPEATDDHDLLLLGQMLLPLSDRNDTSISPVAVQAWEDGWKALSADASVLNTLAPVIASDITKLDAAGYPVRARAYAAGFVSGVHPLPAEVSDSAKAALDHLRSIYDIVLAVADPAPQAVAVGEKTATSVSSATSSVAIMVSEADVRATLSAAGFMFIANSLIRPQENGFYAIQNIVIGTPTGDKMISFLFDPAAGLVSGIEKDGQILPYSLTLEKYLEWVKTN